VHEVPGAAAPTINDEVHDPTPVFDPAPIVVLAAAISQTLLLGVHTAAVKPTTPALAEVEVAEPVVQVADPAVVGL